METYWNPPPATDEEIDAVLGEHAGLAFVDRTRMSRLLCEQLVFGITTRALHSFAVTDVLEALEGHGPQAGRQVGRPFNRPPLRGLLHVHFVQPSFLPRNLANEIRRRDGWSRIERVLEAAPDGVLEDDVVGRIAHEATVGLYEQRSRRGALTGEWIIYAEHREQRLFLGLAQHPRDASEDEAIYNRLLERCEDRFRRVIQELTE